MANRDEEKSKQKNAPLSSLPPLFSQQLLNKKKLAELMNEIDPDKVLDDDVENFLLQIADDFLENVITQSCMLAKHRKSGNLELRDVQLCLDKNWNIWIPGFGNEERNPPKKHVPSESHKQRLSQIKKEARKL
ncbi:Transcription initiation factor TFIID subunit 12-like [Oopsacas minuta]|uniref:Transcription initiation factor TFIID subunit 12 n=1 Tax=Oopsacas minuta TaxID=111878 RepID=A0AAV7JLP1_9METZ|nr:Transcription initiation factor TFIID subunit 12-like [Oopsacas minuta]